MLGTGERCGCDIPLLGCTAPRAAWPYNGASVAGVQPCRRPRRGRRPRCLRAPRTSPPHAPAGSDSARPTPGAPQMETPIPHRCSPPPLPPPLLQLRAALPGLPLPRPPTSWRRGWAWRGGSVPPSGAPRVRVSEEAVTPRVRVSEEAMRLKSGAPQRRASCAPLQSPVPRLRRLGGRSRAQDPR